jgi:hypothetical protein
VADNTQLNQAQAPLGDIIATDDIAGIKHQRVKAQIGPDGVAVDVHDGRPMPTLLGMSSPKTSFATSANLAAAGFTDLDSAQIGSGLTGKLVAVLMTASVPLKGELKTVLNGVESSIILPIFSNAGQNAILNLPNKEFITQIESVTAGFDGFRLTVTNLDNENAADVYAVFFYDEE